jgi:hypothetical protein
MSSWIWEVDWLLSDEFVHLQVVVAPSVEGRESDYHFIGQDSKSPPVNREAMSFLIQDFWSQVFRCATEGVSLGIILEDLGQTKVSQADVSIFIHENILWFQVSVDNMLLM